jgi:hypothetical protein
MFGPVTGGSTGFLNVRLPEKKRRQKRKTNPNPRAQPQTQPPPKPPHFLRPEHRALTNCVFLSPCKTWRRTGSSCSRCCNTRWPKGGLICRLVRFVSLGSKILGVKSCFVVYHMDFLSCMLYIVYFEFAAWGFCFAFCQNATLLNPRRPTL